MKIIKNIFPLLVLTAAILFSCTTGEKKDTSPRASDIIDPDSIVNIITEIHIAEAVIRELKTDSKQKENTAKAYYAEIFEKHGVTRQQYEKSIEYYQQHLDQYQDIYEKVITLLSKKQTEYTSEE